MQKPLVSVIVPIYNAQNNIVRCVESIRRQTYENLEILLLNDGSKDVSYPVCEMLSKADARIVLIDKENSGVSATRNLGMRMARGKYLQFVDADDTLEPFATELLVQRAEDNNADLVIAAYNRIVPYKPKKEAKLAAKAEKQAMREAKKNAKKKKSSSATAPPRQQTEGKKVSGGKGGTTEKKVANTAKDKRITAQQSIPYHEMGRDGICRVQDKFYSKTIRFYDINYQLAQNEDKNAIFENWCDFLNYFDSTIHFQLSFINQHSNMAEYENTFL